MGTKRVFTKMNLRWGYNNVQIKEGDEWKAVFTTYLGVYELIVMFFGLMNLPVTFQTIMNNILRDLINTGEVATFMNNILIGTEEEEKHDEIVEKVLKRMKENDLHIKPEKCA